MKLAFTTLGCPKWDMGTIISRALEYGFDGVDFRGYLGDLDLFKRPEFSSGVRETARRFSDAGLEVPCLSTSVKAFNKKPEDAAAGVEEVRRYAELCQVFGSPYIRIFGGALQGTPRNESVTIAADNLRKMVAVTEKAPVRILVETHDDWIASKDLAAMIRKADSDRVGVLWDTHHPYRMLGEEVETTWNNVGEWIHNTHWKDSILDPAAKHGYSLCLFGDGDIPLRDIFSCLARNGYDGYQTLEWEKMWNPEIPEPELGFPAFVQLMREMAEA